MAYFLVHSLANSGIYMAYFLVHSLANSWYFSLSVLYNMAISGTNGSSGLGSHNKEQTDKSTFEMVSAGDHWDLKISRHMYPWGQMFGWYIFVVNATLGGLNG